MRFKLVDSINEEYIVEGIADVKKYYPTIEDKDFERIIKLDPTTNIEKDKVGTYSKWLLNLFKNKKLDNEGHVTDLLNRFESEKNNLVNKDIMKYKSLEDVEDMLNDDNSYKNKTHRQEVRQRQKDRRNVDLNKDAELVYEDSDWEVWVPKTYVASCRLGQGTNWCTASTESDYYYSYYKDKYGGNYYILINKHNPEEKYQFHFESGQFMDEGDSSIDLGNFMRKNKGVETFFKEQIAVPDKIDINGLSEHIGEVQDIRKDFVKDLFGSFPEEVYDFDYVDLYEIKNCLDKINETSWEILNNMNIDEENIEEEIEMNDDLFYAFKIATRDGLLYGTVNELYEKVANNIKNIIGDFYIDSVWNKNTKKQEDYIIIKDRSKGINNIDWDSITEGDLKYSLLSDIISETLVDNCYDFDENIYNETLQDRLQEIN